MATHTSGLNRDLDLLKRRWWLFIPFLILGILVSLAFGRVTGQSNAVATMQLQTVVHDLFPGGDRGFRIYEADAMTRDDKFKQEVKQAIGDPNFDYARFTITLNPVAVADGVSQGSLVVSIKDDDSLKAEKYRQAFVDVFTKQYKDQDGLFRTRFIEKKQDVVDVAEKNYQAAYQKLVQLAQGKNIPIDALASANQTGGLIDELSKQEAQLTAQQADVEAALATASSMSPATAASLAASVLDQPVAAGDAAIVLQARNDSLKAAIQALRDRRSSYGDGALDPALSAQLDDVRALDHLKTDAYSRLNGARAAAAAGESTIDTSYSASGGLAGSTVGRVSVVVAITLVFGLIAIYGLEWLSQVRNYPQD